jgi:hypothetical protein
MFVKVRQKKTTSTQTGASTFRATKETQVYLPKDAATNTLEEKGTAPPVWKRYVSGLRGGAGADGKSAQAKVVDIKFELPAQ